MTDTLAELPPKKRKWLGAVLKGAVTVTVLVVLVSQADWSGMGARINNVSPVWLAVGMAAKILSLLLATERWRLAIASAEGRIGFWPALRALVTGLFFGQILPGTVGGDVVRGWLTYTEGCPPATVIWAFVIDRALALVACLLLLLIGVGHLPPPIARADVLLLLATAAGLLLLLCTDRVPLLARLQRLLPRTAQFRRALVSRSALAGLVAGVAVHVCTIATAFGFAAALHIPATLADLVVVVPVAIFVAALPISLNGWGAREGAFVAGLALYNIGSGEALALSLMMGFSDMLVSLPGAVLGLLSGSRPPVTAMSEIRDLSKS